LHGHSYRVAVEVEREVEPTLGWVIDFGHIDAALDLIYSTLDHRHLNDIAGLENPTSETLAAWCAKRIAIAMPADVRVACVTIYEGDGGGWVRWTP
jgi:6-pyruvoyltetrahydropterin/6-carboxytetrahydropterin synthase